MSSIQKGWVMPYICEPNSVILNNILRKTYQSVVGKATYVFQYTWNFC